MSILIQGCRYYVPEKVYSNQDLIEQFQLKMKASWVEKRIGITERRWAADEQAASDLALSAIDKLGLNSFKGAIWVSTISGDFYTPSTSSIIKGKMKLDHHLPTFDLNGACAGQIFALDCAYRRLLTSDEDEALVIATEIRSRFLNKADRRTVFLFGDGACVFHLKKNNEKKGSGIHWIESFTIASDQYDIFIPAGGSRTPVSAENLANNQMSITMNDGVGIFEKTTESLVDIIKELLEKKNENLEDYQGFVFHQGNGAIIKKICENLSIDLSKTHINFNKFGNTSSASMGIALAEAIELKKFGPGDKIMGLAMGAGYHIGVVSFTLSEDDL